VSTPVDPVSTAAKQLLKAINQDRSKHDLLPMTLDRKQSRCSLKHSHHMAALGMPTHDGFPADICTPVLAAGENVGYAFGQPSVQSAVLLLHRQMMAEGPCPHAKCTAPQFEQHGHYLNLTSPYFSRVGIGILIRDGAVWLTEDFLGRLPKPGRAASRVSTTRVPRSGVSSPQGEARSF
jgi:hypothetical protein